MNPQGTVDIYILKGFANYFDRRIFFYNDLTDYLTNSTDYEQFTGINFNPSDGVTTSLDVMSDEGDQYSYLLVVDSELGTVISRWYIMEADRNLGGQYKMSLKRDVVAEAISKQEFLINAPLFVEKGHLSDSDPMIVNSEGMAFNQIKQSETILSDPTGCGYIVGYYQSGASIAEQSLPAITETTPDNVLTLANIENLTGISAAKISNLFVDKIAIPFAASDIQISYGFYTGQIPPACVVKQFFDENFNEKSKSWEPKLFWQYSIGTGNEVNVPVAFATKFATYTDSQKRTMLTDVIDNDIAGEEFYNQANYQALLSLSGRTVNVGGDLFTISFEEGGISDHSTVVIEQHENANFDAIITYATVNEYDNWRIYLDYRIRSVKVVLTPYEVGGVKYKLSASANKLNDAPYSMFVIPFGDNFNFLMMGNVPYKSGVDRIVTKEEAFRIAADISKQLTKDKCYDIQLLPYIPEYSRWVLKMGSGDSAYLAFRTGNKTVDVDFNLIQDSGNDAPIGLIIYPRISSFSQTLERNLSLHDSMKIESQCNFYRLCSPNYSGVFEFNLAKMGGQVINFYVDCTYKPINPFIKVAPQFAFLYGSNFNDGRGLICGGDFSLAMVNDQWNLYEQNHKNYATIFAREIQNLDVGQRLETAQEAISLGTGIVAGTAGGAIAGAKAGSKIGGSYGMGIGAGVGAVAGLTVGTAGAAIDSVLSSARRAEAKDFAIDRFNMSLESIKAMPLSLTKVSAFTLINKIFPFIEYYSCTDEEKEALRNKIQYDGMTVGRIGTIAQFQSPEEKHYFKGQLIRAVGIEEDTHFVNTLYEELAKGVYL